MTRVAEDPSVAVASVPAELVQAALRAADELGRQVADVPSAAIAARAGMSRSTLLRRLGGSPSAPGDAVRATGGDAQPRTARRPGHARRDTGSSDQPGSAVSQAAQHAAAAGGAWPVADRRDSRLAHTRGAVSV